MFWDAICRFIKWLFSLADKKWNPQWKGLFAVEALAERRFSMSNTDIIRVELTIPTSPSADTVKKVIELTREPLEGEIPGLAEIDIAADQGTFELDAIQDTTVGVRVWAVDDGGNKSDTLTFTFVAIDTIPPILEGQVTATMIGERSVEVADSIDPEPLVTEGTEDAVDVTEDAPVDDTPVVDEPAEDVPAEDAPVEEPVPAVPAEEPAAEVIDDDASALAVEAPEFTDPTADADAGVSPAVDPSDAPAATEDETPTAPAPENG